MSEVSGEVALGLVGAQAQREDLVEVRTRRGVVVGDRLPEAADGEAAGAQRRRRQRVVGGQQVLRDRLQQRARRIAPLDFDAVVRHARDAPDRALDADQGEMQVEVQVHAGEQRGRAARRPHRHPARAHFQDPELRPLAEEPRARRGRERGQRVRAAEAVAGHDRRLGHERDADPREPSSPRAQAADMTHDGVLRRAGRASARVAHHDAVADAWQPGRVSAASPIPAAVTSIASASSLEPAETISKLSPSPR